MIEEIKVRQAKIEIDGAEFFITHIPTATSGSWYTVHDLFEVWAAVAIDDFTGEVIGWRNQPEEAKRPAIEEAIKNAFGIPV